LWTLACRADILELCGAIMLGAIRHSKIYRTSKLNHRSAKSMSEDLRQDGRERREESWQEYRPVAARPDWWSRLMSFGAMLLAGAALLHSMGGLSALSSVANNAAKNLDNGMGAVSNGVAGVTDAGRDMLAGSQGNPSNDESPGDIGQPSPVGSDGPSGAEATMANADQESTVAEDKMGDVNDLFDEPLDANRAVADDSVSDGTDSIDDPVIELDMLDRNPDLRIVRTVLRPTSETATAVVTIRNTGDGEAVVTDAIFMPTEVVELPFEVSQGSVGTSTADRLVVAFNKNDNQASQAGRHADYERKLLDPFTIPAGETVEVRIAITDKEFIGYGFEGDMRLIFNEDEKLEVSGVTIAFVE
jgi:hypothetical protein